MVVVGRLKLESEKKSTKTPKERYMPPEKNNEVELI